MEYLLHLTDEADDFVSVDVKKTDIDPLLWNPTTEFVMNLAYDTHTFLLSYENIDKMIERIKSVLTMLNVKYDIGELEKNKKDWGMFLNTLNRILIFILISAFSKFKKHLPYPTDVKLSTKTILEYDEKLRYLAYLV